MDLFKSFLYGITNETSTAASGGAFYLLAVSGGVDSVVLCNLFERSGFSYAIAHCNFQLRGAESDRDEGFVRSLATTYGKQLFAKRFDTSAYALQHKISVQVAARDLRYDWFQSLLKEQDGKGYVVTAHHADDNIETVVMNFFRGTGLKGLTGMDVHFNNVYRPLLTYRKKEILAYALELNLAYVEDSSNATSHYTRNYFRNELLPAIESSYPGVEENIIKNINRLAEVQQVYVQAIETQLKKLIEVKGKEEHIPILKLKKLQPLRTMVWEIINRKGFTAAQVDEVIRLMAAENGSYITSACFRIVKNRNWLIVSEKAANDPNTLFVIEVQDKTVTFDDKMLIVDHVQMMPSFAIPTSPQVACIDAKHLHFPLMLRRWKKGDYFYPLGMKKKKKLSRFFIDQKLSRLQKENAWVLECNKKIVWIAGHRIDDRFKITPSTTSIIKFSLEQG